MVFKEQLEFEIVEIKRYCFNFRLEIKSPSLVFWRTLDQYLSAVGESESIMVFEEEEEAHREMMRLVKIFN